MNELKFYMPVSEIAQWMGVAKRTAERYLAEALESGWLRQVDRGNSHGFASSYELLFGGTDNPDGTIPRSDRRTPKKLPKVPTELTGGTDRTDGGVPTELTDQQELTETKQEQEIEIRANHGSRGDAPSAADGGPMQSHLGRALAGIDDDSATGPRPLPDDWHQNGVHVRECRALGLYGNPLARDFKKWSAGKRRTDWDTAFMALIRWIAAEDETVDSGFGDFEAHSAHSGHDDWRDRYRVDYYGDNQQFPASF
ncbi:hypothetical protein [Tsukamurella tyrosinosolvens]|uniref:hypothetical protein n=1 Tax=Tsukamurella tyrosinosolvens TaxID=57704 RepID=UPI002DD4444B|nr:hypothetical protein [Tsukamurella tyrosinosolvens]MEC4614613.1 hypothetical protein [Tsukamurella tyrosinosolvens]